MLLRDLFCAQINPALQSLCGNCDNSGFIGCRGGATMTSSPRGGDNRTLRRIRVQHRLQPALREPCALQYFSCLSAYIESRAQMADDLGDEWWENQPAGAASSPGTTSPASAGPPAPSLARARVPTRFRPAVVRTEVASL
jgi:hypothetical protein